MLELIAYSVIVKKYIIFKITFLTIVLNSDYSCGSWFQPTRYYRFLQFYPSHNILDLTKKI